MADGRLTVTVLPGVPGMESLKVDGDAVPYPESMPDFAKVLREVGFDVRFADLPNERKLVGFKAAELWLPILEFGVSVFAAVEAGILVEVIKQYIWGPETPTEIDPAEDAAAQEGRGQDALLHVDWRFSRPDGAVERFEADGHVDDVLDALSVFENRVRDL